ELEVRPLDDGVDRAGLLAQAAINALDHVDVVAGGAPGAVVAARAGLDGDRLRRADRLAQLAGDAALLAVGIAPQPVLAADARRDRALLERIVEGRLGLEEIAHGQDEGLHELLQERLPGRLIEPHLWYLTKSRCAFMRTSPFATPPAAAAQGGESLLAHRAAEPIADGGEPHDVHTEHDAPEHRQLAP